MQFRDLFRIIQRRWRTVAALVLAALLLAAAASFLVTAKYQSSARVFISTDTKTSQDAYAASLFSAQRVQSYADLADSRQVLRKVITDLSLHITPSQLATQVDSTVIQDTIIIKLTVTDTDAHRAQRIAQATARALASYVEALETPRGAQVAPIKASVIDPASFNDAPVSPNVELNIAVALALGLLLGVTVAVARETLDTSLKSSDDMETMLAAPVMATVAYDPSLAKSPSPRNPGAPSARTEDFRLLRTNLQFADLDGDPRVFVVTSSLPAEGKTSTAVGLATAYAQAGRQVLLIDADLRHPSVAEVLRLEGKVGVTTVLLGKTTLEDALQAHKATGIQVLTSGSSAPNPTEILQSRAAKELFARAREVFDVVIVDSPPLLPVADAAILAAEADGAILVARHGRTHRRELVEARARLDAVGARLFGAVLNMAPRGDRAAYGYGSQSYTAPAQVAGKNADN